MRFKGTFALRWISNISFIAFALTAFAQAPGPARSPARGVDQLNAMTSACAAALATCFVDIQLSQQGENMGYDVPAWIGKLKQCIQPKLAEAACAKPVVVPSEIEKSRQEIAALFSVATGATCAPAPLARVPSSTSQCPQSAAGVASATSSPGLNLQGVEALTEISCDVPKGQACFLLLVRGGIGQQLLIPDGGKQAVFLDPKKDRYCIAYHAADVFPVDQCEPMLLPVTIEKGQAKFKIAKKN